VKEDDVIALIETDKVSRAFLPRTLLLECKFGHLTLTFEKILLGYCRYQGDKGRCPNAAIWSRVS
jgi:hypothetical protein